MALREERAYIQDIQQYLGLNPQKEPIWEFELANEQVFPDEAPTRAQREHARLCLNKLAFVVQDETMRTPEVIKTTYEQYLTEIAHCYPADAFPGFTLQQLQSSARRHVALFQEVNLFEETNFYDEDIQTYQLLHDLLSTMLQDGPKGIGADGAPIPP